MMTKNHLKLKKILIYVSIFLPIFFTLSHGIFTSVDQIVFNQNKFTSSNFEKLLVTPIPFSYFSLVILLSLIISNIFKENLTFLILLVVSFLPSSLVLILYKFELKFILLYLQYLIPFLGIFIGLSVNLKKSILFYIILTINFLILFNTLYLNQLILADNIFGISIYQFYQYQLPLYVFVSCFCLLMEKDKIKYRLLLLVTFLIVLLSYKISSYLIFLLFLIICTEKKLITVLLAILLTLSTLFLVSINEGELYNKINNFNYIGNLKVFLDILNFELPINITSRLQIFEFYMNEISNNIDILFKGSYDLKLDRKFSSAHNLIIDIIYKFGLSLLIPYLLVLYFLVKKFIAITFEKKKIFIKLMILLLAFIFLENFFKVSLKQPYSGIIIFFFIGLMINMKKIKLTIVK